MTKQFCKKNNKKRFFLFKYVCYKIFKPLLAEWKLKSHRALKLKFVLRTKIKSSFVAKILINKGILALQRHINFSTQCFDFHALSAWQRTEQRRFPLLGGAIVSPSSGNCRGRGRWRLQLSGWWGARGSGGWHEGQCGWWDWGALHTCGHRSRDCQGRACAL